MNFLANWRKSNPINGDDPLLSDVQKLTEELRQLRPLAVTDDSTNFPISMMKNTVHCPVDPMQFKVGKWCNTPWDGVTCFGVSISEKEVVVICEVEHPIKMLRHEHVCWSEKLVMIEGVLHEHTTDQTLKPGNGIYFQPAGKVHDPEFYTPSRCVITWRKD